MTFELKNIEDEKPTEKEYVNKVSTDELSALEHLASEIKRKPSHEGNPVVEFVIETESDIDETKNYKPSGNFQKIKKLYNNEIKPFNSYIKSQFSKFKNNQMNNLINTYLFGIEDTIRTKRNQKKERKEEEKILYKKEREELKEELLKTTNFSEKVIDSQVSKFKPYEDTEFAKQGKLARSISKAAHFSLIGVAGLPDYILTPACKINNVNRKIVTGLDIAIGFVWAIPAVSLLANAEKATTPSEILGLGILASKPIIETARLTYLVTTGKHMPAYFNWINLTRPDTMLLSWMTTAYQISSTKTYKKHITPKVDKTLKYIDSKTQPFYNNKIEPSIQEFQNKINSIADFLNETEEIAKNAIDFKKQYYSNNQLSIVTKLNK